MALNIKINLEQCYDTEPLTADLRLSRFYTDLTTQTNVPIGISISNQPHQWLPDVYNLAFGPMGNENEIDDKAKITHVDHSKVFSTIILAGLTFLTNNPGKYLGIDGSNNARAYLYFRIIQNNYDALGQYFDMYGVKYYIRFLRKAKDTDKTYPVDSDDIQAIPEVIRQGERISSDKLYNYFIFKMNEQE